MLTLDQEIEIMICLFTSKYVYRAAIKTETLNAVSLNLRGYFFFHDVTEMVRLRSMIMNIHLFQWIFPNQYLNCTFLWSLLKSNW